MAVVFEHALKPLLSEARSPIKAIFEPGSYGVMLFFLVSGYIVPASLEHRGSLRAFWVSRVFRLYPLFGVGAVGMVGLVALGWDAPHIWWSTRQASLVLGHLTMLQNLLCMPNLINVLWTLSYEMAFYLLLTALFTFGMNRASTTIALGFTSLSMLGASILPVGLLSVGGSGRMLTVALLVTALVAVGLISVLVGSGTVRRAGAVVVGVTVLALLAVNQSYPGPWQGMLIMATMFSGTVLNRVDRGEISWKRAGWAAVVPLAGIWLARDEFGFQVAIAAAWITFGLGMALRNRRMPRVLVWLGLVSYSIYILHPLLLETVEWFWPEPSAVPLSLRLLALVLVIGLLLGLSMLTWRLVEAPSQQLGKRLVSTRSWIRKDCSEIV
ncbi:acyltransferase [Microbispora sp. NEAU-D428]|nr:acyltransferase [Microbispora sitophila]